MYAPLRLAAALRRARGAADGPGLLDHHALAGAAASTTPGYADPQRPRRSRRTTTRATARARATRTTWPRDRRRAVRSTVIVRRTRRARRHAALVAPAACSASCRRARRRRPGLRVGVAGRTAPPVVDSPDATRRPPLRGPGVRLLRRRTRWPGCSPTSPTSRWRRRPRSARRPSRPAARTTPSRCRSSTSRRRRTRRCSTRRSPSRRPGSRTPSASSPSWCWPSAGPTSVLASLARAGTPVGILMRRWAAASRTALDAAALRACPSCAAAASTRVALRYLAAHHDPAAVVFVDGWTGKGAIARELAGRRCGGHGARSRPDLAVLADPGRCVRTLRHPRRLPHPVRLPELDGVRAGVAHRAERRG